MSRETEILQVTSAITTYTSGSTTALQVVALARKFAALGTVDALNAASGASISGPVPEPLHLAVVTSGLPVSAAVPQVALSAPSTLLCGPNVPLGPWSSVLPVAPATPVWLAIVAQPYSEVPQTA